MNYKKNADNQNILSLLNSSKDNNWSGILKMNNGNSQIGAVVIKNGDIIWATASKKKRNLANYLHHKGILSCDNLNEIKSDYNSEDNNRTFEMILTDRGLISCEKMKYYKVKHMKSIVKDFLINPNFYPVSKKMDVEHKDSISFSMENQLNNNFENIITTKLKILNTN
jgi:hypothetical protein